MAQISRIFISGYYGFENAGDEAILHAIIADLRARIPQVTVTAASGNPCDTAKSHGIRAISWQDSLAILDAVSEADLTIVGGGGLFHDYWGFNPNLFLTNEQSGIALYTAPAVLAALLGKPVVLYAIGVGPLRSEHSRRFMKVACEAAIAITVRDEGSKQILQSIGVPRNRVIVTADPVFGLSTENGRRISDFVPEIIGDGKRPLVAVSVRDWDIGVDRSFWEREFAATLDQFISATGGTALFVPFGTLTGQRENDRDVAARIQSQMRRRDSTVLVSAGMRSSELFHLFGSCDLTVGMRLHSLIFSALNHVPMVAVSYDPKIDQAAERIGLQGATDIKSLEADVLAGRMLRALAEASEFRAGISDKLRPLAVLAKQNADIALTAARENRRVPGYWPPQELSSLIVRSIRGQLLATQSLQSGLHDLSGVLARVEAERDESRKFLLNENQVLTKRSEELDDALKRAGSENNLLRAELDNAGRFRQSQTEAISAAEFDRNALREELHRARQFQLEQAESVLRLENELERARLFQLGQGQSIATLETTLEKAHQFQLEQTQVRARLEAEMEKARLFQLGQAQSIATLETALERAHQFQLEQTQVRARLEAEMEKARLFQLEQAQTAARSENQREALYVSEREAILRRFYSIEHQLRKSEELFRAEQDAHKNTEKQLAISQTDLHDSVLTHQNNAKAIEEFRNRFRHELSMVRSQRAWKIMLYFRKAYTMLAREGGRGWLRFAPWTFTVPFTGSGLDELEIRFPDISEYLPPPYRVPSITSATTDCSRGGTSAAVPESGQRNQYDVVILGIIDFDFRFQRPQQMAVQFARTGHRVFWVSPSRFLPPLSEQPYEAVHLREGICEIHLRGPQPDVYMGRLDPAAAHILATSLRMVFRDYAIAENVLILQLPFWRQIGLATREQFGSILAYDCMDDWETFENMGRFNVLEEGPLATECDVLIVSGQGLIDKFMARGIDPVLARNGADFDFFCDARSAGLLAAIPRPVVGYFGAIADWIDLDLVRDVARLRPHYSFVLIGQVFGRDMSELESLPNVHLTGNQKYELIPAFLAEFDACTIPFMLNQVTRATDPVKIYEYLSQGKPVIATDMPELAQCADLIYIARNPGDFASKIDEALSESGSQLKERRIAFARQNTWARRVEAVDARVRQKYPLVSILIVTYNSAEFVLPCLESIRDYTAYPAYEVIVVDNASADATAEMVRNYIANGSPSALEIDFECLPVNQGFAGGNNFAARKARGEYLIFLNADTMVTTGWIGRLCRHFRHDPSIGIICPVTNFAGNEVKVNVDYTNAREMQEFALRLAAEKQLGRTEIEVAPLYCAMLPRKVWAECGALDEKFVVGMFEDDDFSRRVRRAGYRVAAAEDCFIHHFGQGSFSKLSASEYQSVFEANRKLFETKWQTVWKPHKTRPGVRPAFEEIKFSPQRF